MKYSYTDHTGDGTTISFPFSFVGPAPAYLSPSHIKVYVNGVLRNHTLTGTNQVTITPAPAFGTRVLIRRIVPKTTPFADFGRGNNFTGPLLNKSFLQQLYAYHEFLDGFVTEEESWLIHTNINMNGKVLKNLGDGVDPLDSVNLSQVQRVAAGIAGKRYTQATVPTDVNGPAYSGVTWFHTGELKTYTYYCDGDSCQWVEDQPSEGQYDIADDVLVGGVTAKSLVGRSKFKTLTELGGVADGTTDNRTAYVAAINSAVAEGFTLVVTRGIYGFSDWIPLASNLSLVFEEGAEFKLLATTGPIGGFVIGGLSYPSAATVISLDNCHIVNPTIDCNNLVGENGFSSASANGLHIYNPTIKNCIRSDIALGGRAFQFEGGVISGVHVHSPKIINCSIGINSQGDSSGSHVARDINYYEVYMENVDTPFNIDSSYSNPQNNTALTMSTTVRGATLRNCGRLKYEGVIDAVGGGIICGDRGFGLSVCDIRIINDADYGGIGAICRGTMFGVRLRNVVFHGGSMTAIFDHNPVSFGAPSGASWASYVDADDVTVDCNLDYVVATKSGGGALGKSLMTNIKLKGTAATVAAISDPNAASYSDAVLEVVDVDNSFAGTFKGTGARTLSDLAALGNQLNTNTLGIQKINQTSGVWSPVYTGLTGAPSAVTMSGASADWVKTGDMVTVSAYIATSNLTVGGMSGGVVIDGLPFVASTYASCTVSFCAGFTKAPISGVVVPSENKLRLYIRNSTTGQDVAMTAGDLQVGPVVGANAFIFSISYKV